MKRNLNRRIEVLCPVLDEDAATLLKKILFTHLKDNVKARHVNGNRNNEFVRNDEPAYNSQDEVYQLIKSEGARL